MELDVLIAFWVIAHLMQLVTGCLALQQIDPKDEATLFPLELAAKVALVPFISFFAFVLVFRYHLVHDELGGLLLFLPANTLATLAAAVALWWPPWGPLPSFIFRSSGVVAAIVACLAWRNSIVAFLLDR